MNEILARSKQISPRHRSIGLIAAFVAGIVAAQQVPSLPPLPALGLAALLAALCWRRRWRPAAVFLCGLIWALALATVRLDDVLPFELEQRDLLIEGTVHGLPEKLDGGIRFDFQVEAARQPAGARLPRLIRLNWYRTQRPPLAAERWRLRVRLKRPHGMFNPGGMDYELWLFSEGIRATGYVREDGENLRLAAADPTLSPSAWRQLLRERLREALAGRALAGIVEALVMGAEDDISAAQWEVLRRTGTAHLVAISGSHISLIAGLAFVLTRKLCARFGVMRWPPPSIAAVAAILAALLYSALADFAIPTQRALIMIAIVMAGVIARRNVRPLHTLMVALLAVTAYDPLAVLAPGFWLSFGAVALILLVVSNRLRPGAWWRQLWQINWATSLGLAPLLLLFFQQVSLVSPFANLLAVPTIGLILTPLCLAGTALMLLHGASGAMLLRLAEDLLQWIWTALEQLSALSWAQWFHPAPPSWTLGLALPGVMLLLAPRGIPARHLGVILLLPALTAHTPVPAEGGFRLSLLDVGQGLSAVIQTHRHSLVFDAGAKLSESFDMGEAVVAPFLRRQGVDRIDTLVVSHGDNDHIGGVPSLFKRFAVQQTYSSVPERLPMTAALPCRDGQSWEWDGVRFEMLSPLAVADKENDNSCVLRVGGQGGALLTADIEKAAERALVDRYGEALASRVLIAPHHGSNTSSTAPFLATVKPGLVLVPAGYRNRYHFPHREVLRRYGDIGATLLNTASAGAISLDFDTLNGAGQPESYRQSHGGYWNDR